MKKHSYTLIEILVVIAIIVILAGMTLAAARYMQQKALNTRTRAQIETLESAFIQYQSDYGYYPQKASAGALTLPFMNSLTKPNGRKYLKWEEKGWAVDPGSDECLDSYENPIWYECPGTMNSEAFDLWSAGADNKYGDSKTTTETDAQVASENNDDVTNWKRGY